MLQNKDIGLGHLTTFDFKFVPRYGRTTLLGDVPRKAKQSDRRRSPERMLTAFVLLVMSLVGTAAWLAMRYVASLVVVR